MSTPGRTKAAKQPSSIERIQRLERLERERLEEKSRKEERRRQIIAGAKPSGGRHDLVDGIERVTKYPMALLGIAWLVIAIIIGTTDVNGTAPTVLVGRPLRALGHPAGRVPRPPRGHPRPPRLSQAAMG